MTSNRALAAQTTQRGDNWATRKRAPGRQSCSVVWARHRAMALIVATMLVFVRSASAATPPRVGDLAPELELEALLQSPPDIAVDWSHLRGDVVIIEFWATWCGPCLKAIPHLNGLAEKYRDRRVRFISVIDEEQLVVERFLKYRPMSTWIGLDAKGATFRSFGIDFIPQTIIVSPAGRVACVTRPEQLTAEMIDSVLAGHEIHLESKPRPAAASASEEPAPFEVMMRPHPPSVSMRFDGTSFEAKGITLRDAVARVFQVPSSFVVVPPDIGATTYEIRLRRSAELTVSLYDQLSWAVQGLLDLEITRELRVVDVYELREQPAGGNSLKPSHDEASGFMVDDGTFRGPSISVNALCGVLSDVLHKPVVNETRLEGLYDVALFWDPQKTDATVSSLSEQLGLRLVGSRREIELVIVAPVGATRFSPRE